RDHADGDRPDPARRRRAQARTPGDGGVAGGGLDDDTHLMVEFKRLSKRYGGVTAVDDISFRIEPGTLATLLGPSGCEKTTTLRLIAGLEMVSSGTITIGGRDVTSAPASEGDVSMVVQSHALVQHIKL